MVRKSANARLAELSDLLILADMRKALKDNFGGVIVSFDRKIPRYEAAEKAYEQAKQELRDEMKRIHEGLKRLDEADTPERAEKIKSRMTQIAKQDIAEKFGSFVETFVDLVLEYGK